MADLRKNEACISDKTLLGRAAEILAHQNRIEPGQSNKIHCGDAVTAIASDGSTRRFWRFAMGDGQFCIAVAPKTISAVELAEAKSAWEIGKHLFAQKTAVPEIYGWAEEYGLLLLEDLGDQRLHDLGMKASKEELLGQYKKTLAELTKMQILGGQGFCGKWCWDSPVYDKKLMLEKESGYFLEAFWQGFLGQSIPQGVKEEFVDLAEKADRIAATSFLHRDFQSRNIMIKDGAIRVIDFQGGRFGPLGYDLASLLIDPYVGLSAELQECLLDFYIKETQCYINLEESSFRKEYSLLALQRNLQIVGAFSFLYRKRKKMFFKPFIFPSLLALQERLKEQQFNDYTNLRSLVEVAAGKLTAL